VADGFQSGAFQHTVRSPVLFAGVGVHTGAYTRVAIRPAGPETGIAFVRTDVTDRDNLVPVSPQSVCKTQLGTVITNAAGVTVATIEHLMAALVMLGVDNAVVEVDGPEMPIMDGSAADFVKLLERAGKRTQGAARRFIEILETVEVIDGDKRATLKPAMRFEVAFEIQFPTAVIGRQSVDLPMDEMTFRRELADCRTFGFLHEVEALRAMGLARGGSITIFPTREQIEINYRTALAGRVIDEPYLDIRIPSAIDDSLAPPGHHVMSLIGKYYPYRLADGQSWDVIGASVAERIVTTLERYLPNLGSLVVARQFLTPLDLERVFGLTEGDIFHGRHDLDQIFGLRPHPQSAQYATPIPGLYLCGSGAHPGGAVSGAPGRNAATRVIKDAKRR